MTEKGIMGLPLWQKMGTITLEEMDSVKLMNRIDSKYVTTEEVLAGVLADAAGQGYRACVIRGERLTAYHTLYYDTEDLRMYLAHHNGRKVRQKVRVRSYVVSGDTFLEVKRKNNKGRTKKKRIPVPAEFFEKMPSYAPAIEFLDQVCWWSASELSPEATTDFKRITLVNPGLTERITIDTCLNFTNFRNGSKASLGNAVIIELKQDGHAASQMKNILLDHRVHPYRVSKYCLATAITEDEVKRGRFKKKIRYIEKLTGNKLIP